ncbi:hypothetical protein JCM16303_001421 [Sporobolomyces ruberrimus]
MADDRFTYIHERYNLHSLAATTGNRHDDHDYDDMLDWDLPDADIAVPAHLLPPYQDEDDETLLPSQTHSSYPYGNPYRFTSTSLLNSTSLHSTSHLASSSSLSSHPIGSTHSASLPTSLASLELPHLFSLTSFGDPSQRVWVEQNLSGLFGPKTRGEEEEDDEERDRNHNTHGDAGPPAGQNAADGIEDDEEEEEEEGEEEGNVTGGSESGQEQEGGGERTENA